MKIMYHGTNYRNSINILKYGFKSGTFFSKHLEDALFFGGNYIFEVRIINEFSYWEYVCDNIVPASEIVKYYKIPTLKILYENSDLRKKIFDWNIKNKSA